MQDNGEKREKLEKLESKLYSRNAPDMINTERTNLGAEKGDFYEEKPGGEVREDWQDMKKNNFDELAAKISNMTRNKHKFVKKIFLFSVLFFVIAVGATVAVFLGGVNSVSTKNVDIKVVGPVSVGSGQESSFDIKIVNNNTVALESASLLVEYPTGTRSMADLSKEITQERFVLDSIKAGKSYTQNIKAVFYGEKGTSKDIKITLEYRVENSSALFYKEKINEISISSAPIIITPTYPKEVNSNQEISFDIEVASNSQDKIKDFLVNVEYPFGFVFSGASPQASFGTNVWKFSELKPGEKRTISIKGSIVGQDNEERVFRINAGTASPDDERTIGVPFLQLTESILVKKPFIDLNVLIENQSGDFVGQGGKQIVTQLVVRNNLPTQLFNSSVEVSFKGGAFNGLSVYPNNGGFFRSSDNTILWDKRSVPEFSEMGPGYEKGLTFSLSPLSYSSIPSGTRPEIEMTITGRGERILESGSVEKVSMTETRKITLGTDLSVSSRVVRSVGSLENSGPIPPKANSATTYTAVWSISNSFNQVSNVEVRATLPSYVKFTNIKSPQSESVSFNEVTNEVVWNAGSVLPNTGLGSSKREVYFQLEFTPSTSQIGQSVPLLGETSLSGIDKITGLKVKAGAQAVTTNFSSDPSFRTGDDKVVQ